MVSAVADKTGEVFSQNNLLDLVLAPHCVSFVLIRRYQRLGAKQANFCLESFPRPDPAPELCFLRPHKEVSAVAGKTGEVFSRRSFECERGSSVTTRLANANINYARTRALHGDGYVKNDDDLNVGIKVRPDLNGPKVEKSQLIFRRQLYS